jgi:ATP-dependent DNA helicase RecQ
VGRQAEPLPARARQSRPRGRGRKARADEPDDPTYVALKEWRLKRSKPTTIPAYVVFHNSTLAEIAARRPTTIAELGVGPGVGPRSSSATGASC